MTTSKSSRRLPPPLKHWQSATEVQLSPTMNTSGLCIIATFAAFPIYMHLFWKDQKQYFLHLSLLEVFLGSICPCERDQILTSGHCMSYSQPLHRRMNVFCDCQDPFSPITKKRIKTGTWYVKFMLEVTSEVSDVTNDPELVPRPRFWYSSAHQKVLDAANQERNMLTLANVSLSYDAEHQWYGNIVNISRFIHAHDQI